LYMTEGFQNGERGLCLRSRCKSRPSLADNIPSREAIGQLQLRQPARKNLRRRYLRRFEQP